MQNIKNLPDYEFSSAAHDKIMKKIFLLKFRTPFILIGLFSLINLINSGWRLFIKAAEMQTWTIFQTLIQHFELSLDYFRGFFGIMLENTPLYLILAFAVNLILVYFLMNIFKYLKGRIKSHFQNLNQ